jgi:hypothetical protein
MVFLKRLFATHEASTPDPIDHPDFRDLSLRDLADLPLPRPDPSPSSKQVQAELPPAPNNATNGVDTSSV